MKKLLLSTLAGAALMMVSLPVTHAATSDMWACRSAVSSQLWRQGFRRMRVNSMHQATGPNSSLISGTGSARRGLTRRPVTFSCAMNPNTRAMRSVRVGIH
ncbi:MAG TPA: hypothetical protein VKX45_15985 [Bryobacteraceae bacterium]|nr:hypothetical protein [Bryobacteraceae bacterium]